MSFGIGLAGSPAAVRAACDTTHQYESAHGIAVKECVKKLLDGAPAGSLVTVEAGGTHHYSADHPYASVELKFKLTQPLPEPEPEPAPEAHEIV